MNKDKDDLEWKVENPIKIKGEQGQEFTVQCGECRTYIILPTAPPNCETCLERIDLCKHGIACQGCSDKLMLEWIKEGNMKADGEQLKAIQERIKERHGLEVLVNKDGYLEIKI